MEGEVKKNYGIKFVKGEMQMKKSAKGFRIVSAQEEMLIELLESSPKPLNIIQPVGYDRGFFKFPTLTDKATPQAPEAQDMPRETGETSEGPT